MDKKNDMDKNKKSNDHIIYIEDNNKNIDSENKKNVKEEYDNKYRIKSLLTLKNTSILTFTPYLHVRSDGHFSCDEDLQNRNNFQGVFYLKIIAENNDYYDEFRSYDKMHHDNDNGYDKNNHNSYQQTEEANTKIPDRLNFPANSSSSTSSGKISEEELRMLFTDGFLKISNAVDQYSINSCLR